MTNKTLLFKILALMGVLVFVAAFLGFPTKWLWNGLMPDMFGLKTITFWQAVGFNLLGSALFGRASTSKTTDK